MFDPKAHLITLKGNKEYLQVAWRLVWFREDHPDWSLNADILEQDAEHAIFKAVICDENGVQKSSGHGSESKRDFGDFLEKAETKAIGRALAMLGYGTQFAGEELDEKERLADAPLDTKKKTEPDNSDLVPADKPKEKPQQATTPAEITKEDKLPWDEEEFDVNEAMKAFLKKYGITKEQFASMRKAMIDGGVVENIPSIRMGRPEFDRLTRCMMGAFPDRFRVA